MAAEDTGRDHLVPVGAAGRHSCGPALVDGAPVDAAAAAPAAGAHEVGAHLEARHLPREAHLGLLDVPTHHGAQAAERGGARGSVIAGHGSRAAVVVEGRADVGTAVTRVGPGRVVAPM